MTEAHGTPTPNRARLLILDDDPAIGEMLADLAASLGLNARFTSEARDFLELVSAWKPTHLAIDLVMPVMDGVEVLVRLSRLQCRASIFLISGVGERILSAARRSAQENRLHIAGVLQKPFSPDALLALFGGIEGSRSRIPEAPLPDRSPDITVAELRQAFEKHEFRIYYQPKRECKTGRLAGFEALVRWMHPEHGFLMPDIFVEIAEANRLMIPFTDEVVDLSLQGFSRYRHAGRDAIRLSVNISAQNLEDPRFVENMCRKCALHEINPCDIVFELTETSAMADPVHSLTALTRLRMKGFHLALDDFGIGFSSMVHLVRLPFSEIKIDKSFVMKATSSEESQMVVKSIVDLGRSLRMVSTAEGVDDSDTLEFLRRTGCDLVQGYLIGKPVPAEQILATVHL